MVLAVKSQRPEIDGRESRVFFSEVKKQKATKKAKLISCSFQYGQRSVADHPSCQSEKAFVWTQCSLPEKTCYIIQLKVA